MTPQELASLPSPFTSYNPSFATCEHRLVKSTSTPNTDLFAYFMPYYDPDFGFLFLKSGWQQARKEVLRTPLTPEWQEAVSEWIQQATVSEELRSFQESLRRFGDSVPPNPDAEFAARKANLLALLTSSSKKELKSLLATLQFYRQYLAIFPERFIEPLPELAFSEPLVAALRQAPLDLRKELYFTGSTTAYELEPGFFYYAVSQRFVGEIVSQLPNALQGQQPPDLALFLSLAHDCATGEVELLVMDK
jgi:hypothetical protein